jgi:hypothetical protein
VDLLAEFKSSIWYKLYFSDLDDALIQCIIDYVVSTETAQFIKDFCPRLYESYVILATAKGLTDFGIISDGQGGTTAPPLDASPLEVWVKRDEVRDNVREYFKPEKNPCKDCADFPYGSLKAQIKALIKTCQDANSLIGGVGTDYGCRTKQARCIKDGTRN